jgi:hypothetical protein
MNQQGFENLKKIIGLVMLAAGVECFIVQQRTLSMAASPSPASTPIRQILSPTPGPTPNAQETAQQNTPPVVSNILSVADLLTHKEHYLRTRVRVRGKIAVNIAYSARPCPTDGSVCDTTMGAQLELWHLQTASKTENKIIIFRNGEPYPCEKFASEQYRCGSFVDGEVMVIDGTWSKDQVPDHVVGYSGGQPPKVLKWKDRYFLEVK